MSTVARFLTSYLENDDLGDGEVFLKLDGTIWVVMPGGARRQLGIAGGGGTGAVVHGPFHVAFDTAGLTDGVAIYTPTVGECLLDATILVDTAFNGTTPKADIGTFVGSSVGLFKVIGNLPLDLTLAAEEGAGAGVRYSGNSPVPGSLVAACGYNGLKSPWCVFTAANPIKVVVSRTGQKGGASPGATQGAASIYLITATAAA